MTEILSRSRLRSLFVHSSGYSKTPMTVVRISSIGVVGLWPGFCQLKEKIGVYMGALRIS